MKWSVFPTAFATFRHNITFLRRKCYAITSSELFCLSGLQLNSAAVAKPRFYGFLVAHLRKNPQRSWIWLILEMGSQIRLLGLCLWMYLSSLSFIGAGAVYGREGEVVKGIVLVHGKTAIGRIDDDSVCATLDWWPPQKCDYGKCSWGHASLLNLVFFLSFCLLVPESVKKFFFLFRIIRWFLLLPFIF